MPKFIIKKNLIICSFQTIGTVTLEFSDSISKSSLDKFLQKVLWEKLKDSAGNTVEIIRMKVRYISFTIEVITTSTLIFNVHFKYPKSIDFYKIQPKSLSVPQ